MTILVPDDGSSRFPRAGVLATEIADVADNARHVGVMLHRRILRIRRSGQFSKPETETPPDALIWFSRQMVVVAFRLLHAAHHAAGRAVGFRNEAVLEIGGIHDQLGSFILTQDKMSGLPPSLPMPWDPFVPEDLHEV